MGGLLGNSFCIYSFDREEGGKERKKGEKGGTPVALTKAEAVHPLTCLS